jgi:putative ubiquitin-RnfH superfamily antitoxin RatB of RatAB toxin-antitoxin module
VGVKIEVAWALADKQTVAEVELQAPATVADALAAVRHRGLPLDADFDFEGAVGVFGELVEPSRQLREGDRVELYRPLQVDPKTARRRRAETRSRR